MKPVLSYRSVYAYLVIVLLFCLAAPFRIEAQISPSSYSYPHNHLPWFTVESDHFLIHFQKGNKESALVISEIAEEIYEPVTSLYNFTPGKKTSIVLRDREDISNGAAYFFDDKIEIWLPSLDTPLRGTHPWLRNVITHEFTHIVQLGASMKRSSNIPAIYLQWLSYEDIRRPDILYGFPKGIVTLPFSTVSIPAWFAEGTAQYQRENLYYDYWDSHRDMILRTRILSDTQLSLEEMETFSSKNSLERELVYNQGFSFILFLTENFGESVIAELTHHSAESAINNFNKVIEQVTDIKAYDLYQQWINQKRSIYKDQVADLDENDIQIIETDGFFNYYPQFSPDHSYFAYLSNRGKNNSITKLIIRNSPNSSAVEETAYSISDFSDKKHSSGHTTESELNRVSNRFSFSPDGKQVLFTRSEKNKFGETYKDIYLVEIESQKVRQVTNSARISDPDWHPERNIAVAVQQHNGRQNIVLVNLDTSRVDTLTNFPFGTSVFSPVWSSEGNEIYFSAAAKTNRNIYKYNMADRTLHTVLSDPNIDFRDPSFDHTSGYLYFSSDLTGIFNIYRKKLNTGIVEKLTDVTGGAFMPFHFSNEVYFSHFNPDGYKISKTQLNPAKLASGKQISEHYAGTDYLTNYQSNPELSLVEHTSSDSLNADFKYNVLYTESDLTYSRAVEPYTETTTGYDILPLIRFDNYSKLNGSNSRLIQSLEFGRLSENIWRDMKVGAYFSSRDVTESLSIFGGLLFGLGSIPSEGLSDFLSPSRVSELDRDIFLIAEYKGLPFIKKSWSPTISVEFYNMVRNVRNGIQIEEFPCTSCFPAEKSLDIRYTIWEANLFLRSKLNRWSLLELGASYSPYRVNTDGFFSEEFREFIPSSSTEYFRGFSYTAAHISDLTIQERHSDIAPIGFKSELRYNFEPSKLLNNFELNEGVLSPVFIKENNHSVEVKNRYGFSAFNSVRAMITSRFFSYLNSPENSFYLDYAGGLSGLRSYPYFAIGGQQSFFVRPSFLFPIITDVNNISGAYNLNKVFAHIFFETGNAWGGPLNSGNKLKNGAGAELRFSIDSNYLFPLKLFINTTYGFNDFTVTLPSDFLTPGESNTVTYGREILFYFGLTFDFEFL